jgi:hypothetical protein
MDGTCGAYIFGAYVLSRLSRLGSLGTGAEKVRLNSVADDAIFLNTLPDLSYLRAQTILYMDGTYRAYIFGAYVLSRLARLGSLGIGGEGEGMPGLADDALGSKHPAR